MNNFLTDIRFALRQLAAKPGFAAAAIATLALGIGANIAVFSMVSGYLFKPLPYPNAGRLVQVHVKMPKYMAGEMPVSLPMQQVIQKHANVFAATAIYGGDDYNMRANGKAFDVYDYMATGSLFQILGVRPALGRVFTDADFGQGNDHVAVLSYAMWHKAFGGDPGVIGKEFTFASKPYRVIGVMPKGFAFPNHDAEMWTPMEIGPNAYKPNQFFALQGPMIGLLKPGVSAVAAQRQIHHAIRAWLNSHLPVMAGKLKIDRHFLEKTGFEMQSRPFRKGLLGQRPATLWLLQGAVLLILLITCVNVANLLLSRILGRSHEMAMRGALGASRPMLAKQLLTEALCLTVPGGLIGVGLGWLGLHFLTTSALGAGASVFDIALDWRVGLFALGAVLFTAALVSVLPIRHLAKTDLQTVLKEGTRTSSGGQGAKRVRSALVIVQLTLATGLLAVSGLLLHSFMNLQSVNPGYRTDHLLIAHLTVSWDDFPNDQALSNAYKEVVRRVNVLPGVVSAGVTDLPPLTGTDYTSPFSIVGRKVNSANPPVAMKDRVTSGFLKTMGIPILRGRYFDERDTGKRRAIVDMSVVKRYFHGGDPIGQQIKTGDGKWTIIGVVPSFKYTNPAQPSPTPAAFLNIDTNPSSDMYLVVHTKLPPAMLKQPVTNLIAKVAPKFAVNHVHTMHEQMSDLLSRRQTTMALLLIFGIVALALSIIGVYGVLSYAVGQRRNEFGIRLALGAMPSGIRRLVILDGLKLLVIGLVVGIVLAIVFGEILSSRLFDVAPYDPLTLVGTIMVLLVVTFLACYIPARRASKMNPAEVILDQ